MLRVEPSTLEWRQGSPRRKITSQPCIQNIVTSDAPGSRRCNSPHNSSTIVIHKNLAYPKGVLSFPGITALRTLYCFRKRLVNLKHEASSSCLL
mmetsp:Transcript_137054/g.382153  ORF Transcript_137054/g.382153 Transcript_137054/m.382153 type:complete len:94 (+) Transcript_137054:193-474(+)